MAARPSYQLVTAQLYRNFALATVIASGLIAFAIPGSRAGGTSAEALPSGTDRPGAASAAPSRRVDAPAEPIEEGAASNDPSWDEAAAGPLTPTGTSPSSGLSAGSEASGEGPAVLVVAPGSLPGNGPAPGEDLAQWAEANRAGPAAEPFLREGAMPDRAAMDRLLSVARARSGRATQGDELGAEDFALVGAKD